MKKHQIITFLIMLPLQAFALSIADLDVDPRVRQQIADSFALEQSIRQFTESRTATIVTVGGDNACDYRVGTNKIQDAINRHNDVEIRIAQNDVYNENLVINDNNVSLRGGYENCTDAADDIHAPFYAPTTAIRGVTGSKNPVIKIVGNTQRSTIVLERLFLSNGEGETTNFPGGGISIYQADMQINIINTFIANNNSLKGGGIAIVEGDTDIIATDLTLSTNTAQSGGGIHCDGGNASLIMYGSNRVSSNMANGTALTDRGGGGIDLVNGCSFLMYSGGIINNNTATSIGGGINAWPDPIVTLFGHKVCSLSGVCFGNNTEPVSLTNNQSQHAGGIVIAGDNAVLSIYGGNVRNNKATNGNGGGVAVIGNATFIINRLSKACWSQEHCNYFANNSADYSGFFALGRGGAINCGNATMSITNAVFAYNRAEFGTVVAADSCTTSIRGSLMYQNGNYGAGGSGDWEDNYVIYNNDGMLSINHATIADNKSNLAVLHNENNNVEIVASIIHDASTGPVLSSSSTNVNVECSMLHEDASISAQVVSVVGDPEFIDRANRNYRLNAQTSPAVDYCDTNTGNYSDLDFEERGWDDPLTNNIHGPFDIGADETYGGDIIFAHGFD